MLTQYKKNISQQTINTSHAVQIELEVQELICDDMNQTTNLTECHRLIENFSATGNFAMTQPHSQVTLTDAKQLSNNGK